MKREPKLKECANEECTESFTQYKSTVKVCSMSCAIAYASQKRLKDEIKQAKREKTKHHIDEMTQNKYRAVKIQPLMNELARILDKGQPCIGTGKPAKKENGGHYHSVGSNVTLSLNLHNIHLQSEHSNNNKCGDSKRYRHNLIKVYSPEYAEFIDMYLMQCPPLHLTKTDLVELRPRLKAIVKKYKELDKVYTSDERIQLRNDLNEELGIYPESFAKFETIA